MSKKAFAFMLNFIKTGINYSEHEWGYVDANLKEELIKNHYVSQNVHNEWRLSANGRNAVFMVIGGIYADRYDTEHIMRDLILEGVFNGETKERSD